MRDFSNDHKRVWDSCTEIYFALPIMLHSLSLQPTAGACFIASKDVVWVYGPITKMGSQNFLLSSSCSTNQ